MFAAIMSSTRIKFVNTRCQDICNWSNARFAYDKILTIYIWEIFFQIHWNFTKELWKVWYCFGSLSIKQVNGQNVSLLRFVKSIKSKLPPHFHVFLQNSENKKCFKIELLVYYLTTENKKIISYLNCGYIICISV